MSNIEPVGVDGETPEGGGGSDAENSLVLAPSMGDAAAQACGDLVGAGTDLVLVSLSSGPDQYLDAIARHEGQPDRVAAISCDTTRGATAVATTTASGGRFRSCTVADPGDLTGLAIRIDEGLAAWADGPGETVLCLDSLTALLQYADLSDVFRFCHSITRKAERTGVPTHFHLDPSTVSPEARRTLESLFDRTIDRT